MQHAALFHTIAGEALRQLVKALGVGHDCGTQIEEAVAGSLRTRDVGLPQDVAVKALLRQLSSFVGGGAPVDLADAEPKDSIVMGGEEGVEGHNISFGVGGLGLAAAVMKAASFVVARGGIGEAIAADAVLAHGPESAAGSNSLQSCGKGRGYTIRARELGNGRGISTWHLTQRVPGPRQR